MIAEDEAAVAGRKKICGLMPYQGRMVIEFMSMQTSAWKESQIRNHPHGEVGARCDRQGEDNLLLPLHQGF